MASNVTVVIATKGAKDAANDIHEIGVKAEESGGHLGKLGSALGSIGTIAGGIIAAKGIEELGGAIKGAFSDAISFQKLQAQTAAVLQSTGGAAGQTAKSVRDLANSLEAATAIDDATIQSAENMLLTFTNIGKDVFPAATEAVLNMSTALGEDANTAAVQLGKALNDPVAGVTALQRVGVKLTDSQKDLVKSLVETGNVAGAQKVILGELNTEFGNSARAAGQTLGGQLSLLKDAFSDAFRDLMVKIIPSLTEFATNVVPLVSEGLSKAVDVLSDLASAAADIAAAGWDKISGPLADLAGIAWDGLQAGAEALASLYEWEFKLATVAWDKISGPLADLTSLSWDGLRAGIDSLKALADSKFEQVAPQFQSIATSLKGIDLQTFADGWNRVKEAIQPAVDALKPLVEQLLKALKDQFQQVGEALKPLGGALKDLAAAFAPLEPLLKPLGIVLGTVIVAAIGLLLVSLRLFTEFLTITLVGAIKVATLAIEGIAAVFEKVLGLLAPYIAKFISIGTDIIEGLFEGVKKGAEPLWNWLKDVGDSIVRFVGNLGRILFDAGKAVIQGLWDGISSMLGWFGDKLGSIGGFISAHKGPIDADALLLVPHGQAIMRGLASGIMDGYQKIVEPMVSGIAAQVSSAFGGAPSTIKDLGGDFGSIVQDVTGKSVKDGGARDWATLLQAHIYTGAAAEVAGVKNPAQGVYYQVQPQTINLVVDGAVLASAQVRAADLAMS